MALPPSGKTLQSCWQRTEPWVRGMVFAAAPFIQYGVGYGLQADAGSWLISLWMVSLLAYIAVGLRQIDVTSHTLAGFARTATILVLVTLLSAGAFRIGGHDAWANAGGLSGVGFDMFGIDEGAYACLVGGLLFFAVVLIVQGVHAARSHQKTKLPKVPREDEMEIQPGWDETTKRP